MIYLENYNEFSINENLKNHKYINKIYDFLMSDKMKDKTKDFLLKCKEEVDDYKEVGSILKKAAKDGSITKSERKIVYEQLVDTLKIGGTASLFLLPFGTVLIYGLIKIGKKFGINFLPSAWKQTNESYYSNKYGYEEDVFNYIITKNIYKLESYIKENGVDDNYLLFTLENISRIDYNIIRLLIENGANVNAKNSESDTPLILISYWSSKPEYIKEHIKNISLKIIQLMIDAGANWNDVDDIGNDFLYYLKNEMKEKVINLYPEKYQDYLKMKKANEFNI